MPKKFQVEVKDDDAAQTGSAWREIARKREAEIQRIQRRVAELEADTGALSLVIEQQDRTLSRYREALEKLARLGNGGHYGNSIGNEIAIQAIPPAYTQFIGWQLRAALMLTHAAS